MEAMVHFYRDTLGLKTEWDGSDFAEFHTASGALSFWLYSRKAFAQAFNENYKALKAQMIEGTAGYVGVMESYREVNMMPKYDSYKIDSKGSTNLVAYTEKSLSCRVEFSVTRTRTLDGTEQTDTLTGSISVLQVLYRGEWRVWSFVYEQTVVE